MGALIPLQFAQGRLYGVQYSYRRSVMSLCMVLNPVGSLNTHMRDSTHDFPVLQNGTAAHALHYPQNCYLTKIFPLTIITYNSALHILKFDFRSLSSFLRSEHHQRQPYWKKHLFANNYYIFLSIIPLNLKTDHF